MYLPLALSSLLAASALATPLGHRRRQQSGANEVTVLLQNQGIELGSGTTFDDVTERQTQPPTASGPFLTVAILVDENAAQQDLRCQILDQDGEPLVATRGDATDITFADGGNGPWTFDNAGDGVRVSEIICDPAFVAGGELDNGNDEEDPADFEVRVILQNQGIELGSQTVFEDFEDSAESGPVGSSGPYTTVELVVGAKVDPQDLRCKIFDRRGRVIPVLRGGNRDTSFADGDGGLWTFVRPRRVGDIVCDADFQADPVPVSM